MLSNKELQLDLLSNAIADAKLAYESALIQFNKLAVRSPVFGVIGEVLVSEGQEIGVGTPIFKVSGNKKQQIEVFVTAEEYRYLNDQLPVQIQYQQQILTGTIDAMSPVADRTNLFKATIQLSQEVPLLGEIAKVSFPIQLAEQTLLPLEQVKILNPNEASLQILSGGKVTSYLVKIKKVWGAFLELEEPLPEGLRILQ